MTGQNTR